MGKNKPKADFENLKSLTPIDQVDLAPAVDTYDPTQAYAEEIAAEISRRQVAIIKREVDRDLTITDLKEDLNTDAHKALRYLSSTLEDPEVDTKEKIASSKAILAQSLKERELSLKEKSDKEVDEREKAKIMLMAGIDKDQFRDVFANMGGLISRAVEAEVEDIDD